MSGVELLRLESLSLPEEINPENDNVDVVVYLNNGRAYTLLIATPQGLIRCMRNENVEHFFSYPPPLVVSTLDEIHVSGAVEALVAEPRIFAIYGVLQAV